MYVPDSFNNRVLFYERPFETDTVADAVWGHADFSGMICNQGSLQPTAGSLCFHSDSTEDRRPAMDGWPASGVDVDTAGNLWVADSGNNRVLRFPWDSSAGKASREADLVLGQSDFRRNEHGTGLQNLHTPAGVRFDPQGKLHVADAYNHRILVFEPPFVSGMSAQMAYGAGFHNPIALQMDPENRGVWVNYFASQMVVLWNWDGTEIIQSVGVGIEHPGGFDIDASGNLLVVQPGGFQDVLRFPSAGTLSDKRLFPPGGSNYRSDSGIGTTRGVAASSDQLIVSDFGRLMFWNGLGQLTNGKPADGVIGDPSFRTKWTACCGKIKADDAGRLWVLSEEGTHGFIDVYQLPLTRLSAPLHTIWTRNASFPVLGSNAEVQLGLRMFGIAPTDGGAFVWVSDTDNHRVMRIKNPLTSPVVDVIIGQQSPHGDKCNRRARVDPWDRNPEVFRDVSTDMLCFPGDLSVDNQGNLWVSDHSLEVSGNWRLLMFSKDLFPEDSAKAIFAPVATKVFLTHGNGDSRLIVNHHEPTRIIANEMPGPYRVATFEAAFNNRNQMAVGFNMYIGGRFVAIYDDPSGFGAEPTAYLNDLASMPFAATFDDNDNLYVGDINRARVLVYWNPLNSFPREDGPAKKRVQPAPLPEYPAIIRAVNPQPPYCVLRYSDRPSDKTLELTVDGLPNSDYLELQFRKVTSPDLYTMPVERGVPPAGGTRILRAPALSHLWSEYEKTTATIRVLQGGQPLTSWASLFIIADDSEICGHSQPIQDTAPTPTTIPSATLAPEPAATTTPLPVLQITPALETAVPETPSPRLTPSPTATITIPLPTATAVAQAAIQATTAVSPIASPRTGQGKTEESFPEGTSALLIAGLIIAALVMFGLGFAAGRMPRR